MEIVTARIEKDPVMRRLAEEIIVDQQSEIDVKAQRRYLVIAPASGTELGAPVQVQGPMTNGRPPAINGSTAPGGRLPTSIRIRLRHQDKRFKEKS